MLRLAGALHRASPDPVRRKRLLLDGLCRLVRADGARSVVTWFDPATARRVVLSAVDSERPDAPADVAVSPGIEAGTEAGRAGTPDGQAVVPPSTAPIAEPFRVGEYSLDSFVDLDGMRLVATLTVRRRRPGRSFTPRDRAIVEIMHTETSWIYAHDRMRVAPEVLALPPRERETLQLLTGGEGERRIADLLHISTNTVHHYVKSLYRRFGVRSRSELIGRWEGRSGVAGPAGRDFRGGANGRGE